MPTKPRLTFLTATPPPGEAGPPAAAPAALFPPGRRRGGGRAPQPQQRPDDRRKNHQRQYQMRRQPILRDLDPVGEARGHHPPADRTLQRAETEDQPQPPLQLGSEHAAPEEEQERQQIDRADHAAEQPVAPFPPEDGLELAETHA